MVRLPFGSLMVPVMMAGHHPPGVSMLLVDGKPCGKRAVHLLNVVLGVEMIDSNNRSILRNPPFSARERGLDPELPICICGEQVAVPHKECIALFDFREIQENA